jgi:pimeloyl-ACP methyl ester carboxylesterase
MRFLLSVFFICLIALAYFPISLLWRESKVLDSKIQLPGRFILAADGPLYTQQVGFPEQPAVVYFSGEMAWSENWKPTMSFLAQHGFRGVALDIPPWGLSPGPISKNYGRMAQALRIKSAIENLHLKDFILVSHGDGAKLALTVVGLLENRVRALVLISPDVGISPVKGQGIQMSPSWVQSIMRYALVREFTAAIITHPWFTKPALDGGFYNKAALNAGAMKVYNYPFYFKGENIKVSDWLYEHTYGKDLVTATDVKFYEQIRLPTLILWGERDAITPPWQTENFKTLLPQAEVTMIKNAGHNPQMENEVLVNEALLKFIGRILQPVNL